MENERIVYEFHTVVGDISLRDARSIPYRTKSGRIRPHWSFCFAPRASLVLAYNLSADPMNQQTFAALLYAALIPSAAKVYSGIPDEVWFSHPQVLSPSVQQALEHLGILSQNRSQGDPFSSGNVERFLARLQQEFWETLYDPSAPDTLSDEKAADLTLFEVDSLLRSYLIAYNQAVHDNSGASLLPTRQAHPSQLATLLGEPLSRTLMRDGISYRGRKYWHQEFETLAPGTNVSLLLVPSFSISSPETIEVFFQARKVCSLAVQR